MKGLQLGIVELRAHMARIRGVSTKLVGLEPEVVIEIRVHFARAMEEAEALSVAREYLNREFLEQNEQFWQQQPPAS